MKTSRLLIPLLLLSGLALAPLQAQDNPKAIERQQFLEVAYFAQLPESEQTNQIARIYKLLPSINERRGFVVFSILYLRMPWKKGDEKLAPEVRAKLIEGFRGGQYFSTEAKFLSRELLQKHRAAVEPLLRADLRSKNVAQQKRGMENLREMGLGEVGERLADFPESPPEIVNWLPKFYPDVLRIFRSQPALKKEAVSSFGLLGDSRALAVLIRDDPQNPLRYYESLSSLSRNAPDDSALLSLLPLLQSPDATKRYQALWALGNVNQTVLFPHVRRLMDDPDKKVRWLAVSRAFQYKGAEKAQLEPLLREKLADPDPFVRYIAAEGFARRQVPIGAPTLLALLRDETIEINRWAVSDAIRQLTGTNFGYNWDGATPRNPDVARQNAEAIEKFEGWIKENAAF